MTQCNKVSDIYSIYLMLLISSLFIFDDMTTVKLYIFIILSCFVFLTSRTVHKIYVRFFGYNTQIIQCQFHSNIDDLIVFLYTSGFKLKQKIDNIYWFRTQNIISLDEYLLVKDHADICILLIQKNIARSLKKDTQLLEICDE